MTRRTLLTSQAMATAGTRSAALPRPTLALSTLSMLLALTAATAPGAQAWCQMTTESPPPTPGVVECATSGVPLSWNRACLGFALDDGGARDFDDATLARVVQRSFSPWTSTSCDGVAIDFDLRLFVETTSVETATFNLEGGNANSIIFVSDWNSRGGAYDRRAFALTTVWHNTRTGRILDTDIEINEQLGTYADCDPVDGCDDGRIDLSNVIVHEVGHALGLAHSGVPDATMYFSADEGEVEKRTLDPDDVLGACTIYPPGTLPACGDEANDFEPEGGFDGGVAEGGGCSASAAPTTTSGAWLLAPLLAVAITTRRRRPRA